MKKIVVDTDIIAEHLLTGNKESILRALSREYFCYTTVFNAIELFGAAKSLKEKEAVRQAMDSLKVLGISPKSAKNIGEVVSSTKKDYTALIAGVCLEAKLPIVTMRPKRFAGIRSLKVIPITLLLQ
ncbi:MAG: type II toxin-antitoxin system VapC family toxin [Bacteroidota bacterium]